MAGIGIIVMYIGYAIVLWGVNSFQGNSQAPFISQIFPFDSPTTAPTSPTVKAPPGTEGPQGTTTKAATTNLGKTVKNSAPPGLQGPVT